MCGPQKGVGPRCGRTRARHLNFYYRKSLYADFWNCVVKAWVIYARAPGSLRLLVWRKSSVGTNKYTLVRQLLLN
jgi:hypothetical protein